MKTSPDGAPIESGRGIQSVREQIEKAFAPIRTVERRQYVHPGELDPALVGRRKDDPAKLERPRPALSLLAKPILEVAVKAAPLLYHRRPDALVHDLGDVSAVEDVPKLFEAALTALGYQPQEPSSEPERSSVWTRNIFRRAR